MSRPPSRPAIKDSRRQGKNLNKKPCRVKRQGFFMPEPFRAQGILVILSRRKTLPEVAVLTANW